MKIVTPSNQFKRDFKRDMKRGKDPRAFQDILALLVKGEELPMRCFPHKLSGKFQGFWECHIEPDWLLIYDSGDDYVDLARIGTHADLFK